MGSIPAQDEGAPPSIQDAGQLYLVGTGVSHAMAPVIHNSVAQQIGSKWHFSNLDVQTKEEALKYIRRADFKGCVPTMPLKIQLLDAVDEVDRAAQAIGAINNIYQRDGQLLGANTDWIGILRPLQKEMARQGVQNSAQGSSGWQGLIVGAGGASRAAAYALTKLGCQTIFIVNRDDDEVKALVSDVQKGFTSVSMQVPTIEHLRTVEEAQRIISQAAGTEQSPPLLAVSCVPDLEPKSEAEKRASAVLETVLTGTKGILLEMAYKPRITRTFLSAQTHGWRVIEGIHVIAEQVQTVWRLFSGIELTDGQARTAQDELWKQAATRDELNANGIPEPLSV
ncbi:putative Pentafunctional AROM polypeptide (putative) [Pseudozyma hubeiensis]|nr:putative Pentafunctional AROM polypeptide (putative) [Pseudozyma hubeiensis]